MPIFEQMVPSSDIFNDMRDLSVCQDCLDPLDVCTCSWQIMQLDASYSIYTALNDNVNKPSTANFPASSLMDGTNKLDGLNCGGIPTRTTPTLTPTTLRNIAADIESMTAGQSENFAAAAASDLHHLVTSSVNVSSSGAVDRLNTDLQERHNLQTQSSQHLSLQGLNNQHTISSLNSLHNHQNINPNSLNQQQHNEYNNAFSSTSSRQAGFVPPLVLQINSSVQQSSGSTALINSNNSVSSNIFNAKGSSTSTSSSHWQGAVVTQRRQSRSRSATRRQFTDDEDVDDDYDSAADDGSDSSDTTSGKTSIKQSTKNSKSGSKTNIKSEFKNTGNTTNSGRRSNKDNKLMSAEEEHRRQIRRERNKLAAARCRKRRMDHTNELLEETEQLEDKRLKLQVEIQGLRQQKTDLQQMLAQHKCVVNVNNGSLSNSVSTINHTTTLEPNAVSDTAVSNNKLSMIKRNPLQQQKGSSNIDRDNDTDFVDDVLIKSEDHSVIQTDNDNKNNIDLIPTTLLQPTVLQQPHRRRPTTLLQLNNGNYGNVKKESESSSSTNVVLNFDSLMEGGTGLTPVSTTSANVQSHHSQAQRGVSGKSSVNSGNNSLLS